MRLAYSRKNEPRTLYVQKSYRDEKGASRTKVVERLGTLDEIREKHGCQDAEAWAREYVARLTAEEKSGKASVSVRLSPDKRRDPSERPLRIGGDMFLLPLYNALGLPAICKDAQGDSRAKYDMDEVVRTLVMGRILFPGSKSSTLEKAGNMVFPPKFGEDSMYRALTAMADSTDDIQSALYINSQSVTRRRDRALFYDCTNYYFEIEDDDPDIVHEDTGEVEAGLRKRGKSKEGRTSPLVQMGLFMDMDGIPLAFKVFPGNESEQTSMQPLEEVLNRKFMMTDYIVSTDAGLASESNRRYNMAEGRDYICVQSIPSMKASDQEMAIAPEGWRVSYRGDCDKRPPLDPDDPKREIFDLGELKKRAEKEAGLLADTTFYKEILVEKALKEPNPAWAREARAQETAEPLDSSGNRIPKELESKRTERIIVTYSHDFALYLRHKRDLRLASAMKIVKSKSTKSRQSQQDPRHYVTTIHKTKKGERAVKVEMVINTDIVEQEKKLDGYYAYGSSLEDDAVDVLAIRSLHNEVEHLFRTTKSFLDARPVFLSRPERIKAHFLVCFIAMVLLKLLQKLLKESVESEQDKEAVTIDALIEALRGFSFDYFRGQGYRPLWNAGKIQSMLQAFYGIDLEKEITTVRKMKKMYALELK